MTKHRFTDQKLAIELDDGEKSVDLIWSGRSTAREPNNFIAPIVEQALELAAASSRELILDFRNLEFFNSSTMSPMVRLLQQARSRNARVRLIYAADLHWQALSFAALEVFHSDADGIIIEGR